MALCLQNETNLVVMIIIRYRVTLIYLGFVDLCTISLFNIIRNGCKWKLSFLPAFAVCTEIRLPNLGEQVQNVLIFAYRDWLQCNFEIVCLL